MRYRAAVGVGEEAHSRQRHWCPWSKPVNVETWGHVPGPVVMAHAFAELRYGIVARQHENGFKCGYISAQTLIPQVRFLRAHSCERLLGFLGGPKPPLPTTLRTLPCQQFLLPKGL